MNTPQTNTQELALTQTHDDFKHAVLVVSVLLNLVVLTTWLVIQADARYALVLVSGA